MEVFAQKLAQQSSYYECGKYLLNDFWHEFGDQRVTTTSSYWLVRHGMFNSIWIVSLYLLFSNVIGPRLMRNRKPFSLKWPMLVYNLSMASVNLYFLIVWIGLTRFGLELSNFTAPDSSDRSPTAQFTINLSYLYLISKFFDFFDTIFFVLRKKSSQLNFLHLYHHSSVPILGTIVFILHPTLKPVEIFILLNSFIHTVMYSYYGLAALGPWMQPYLWWKRYITQIQIVQFVLYILYLIPFVCHQQGYSPYLVLLAWTQAPLFLYLFVRFYRNSYKRSERKDNVCSQIKKVD